MRSSGDVTVLDMEVTCTMLVVSSSNEILVTSLDDSDGDGDFEGGATCIKLELEWRVVLTA